MDCYLEFRYCAALYRPLYHETECFIAIDSLQLINTFVKNSTTILLEINLDDWAVYLSKQKRDRNMIEFFNNHVCVISGGAFSIRICFNEIPENAPLVNQQTKKTTTDLICKILCLD